MTESFQPDRAEPVSFDTDRRKAREGRKDEERRGAEASPTCRSKTFLKPL